MKPIVRTSLWQRRWYIFWWLLGIAGFIALELAFYPTIRDQAAELEKSFSRLSDSAIALFSDTGDFFSPVGYLSGQIFYVMLPLLLGILSIGLGASLIAKEEKDGTIELLLSRPISRLRLLMAKSKAGLVIVLLAGLVSMIVTAGMAKLVNLPVPVPNILWCAAACSLLAISFGAVAFMITTLGRTARGAAIGLASLYALAGYLIASLSAQVEWLRWPAKLFPFDYYHPAEILRGTYNWYNLLFMAGLIFLCALISAQSFRKRDIKI